MDRAGRQGLRHRPRHFQHRRAGRERDRQLESARTDPGQRDRGQSITAWRKLDSIFGADHDHSPVLIDDTFNDYSQRQFSQELQVTGSSKLLNWAAGVYYFRESGTDANTVDFSIGSLLSGARSATAAWPSMDRRR
jgi:hypothetical protein